MSGRPAVRTGDTDGVEEPRPPVTGTDRGQLFPRVDRAFRISAPSLSLSSHRGQTLTESIPVGANTRT